MSDDRFDFLFDTEVKAVAFLLNRVYDIEKKSNNYVIAQRIPHGVTWTAEAFGVLIVKCVETWAN